MYEEYREIGSSKVIIAQKF